jgi:hypothetical protein
MDRTFITHGINAYQILVKQLQWKRPIETGPKCMNIKRDLRETACEIVKWI